MRHTRGGADQARFSTGTPLLFAQAARFYIAGLEAHQRGQAQLLLDAFEDALGRPAPLLVSEDGVRRMAPGSVVVDLAAPNGGNCALTRPGEVFDAGGVRVFGPLNLPAEMPLNASQMYARTLSAMILEWIRDGEFAEAFESFSAAATHEPIFRFTADWPRSTTARVRLRVDGVDTIREIRVVDDDDADKPDWRVCPASAESLFGSTP